MSQAQLRLPEHEVVEASEIEAPVVGEQTDADRECFAFGEVFRARVDRRARRRLVGVKIVCP
jgi:hypothetical protein